MDLKQVNLESLYLSHATRDRTAASAEVLENARSKHLTSAATWEGLAAMMRNADVVHLPRLHA